MLDPSVRTIEVPCGQEKAFGVFVNEMSSWWPLDKYSVSVLRGQVAGSLRVEPKQGGKIVEIGNDGTEYLWGTFESYDPYDSFSMDFHMGLPAPESPSLVEVRFTALGDERTRVELNQSNWEAYGDKAAMMRGGYGGGWVVIFEQAYRAACGG